jgi:hypothetical protein
MLIVNRKAALRSHMLQLFQDLSLILHEISCIFSVTTEARVSGACDAVSSGRVDINVSEEPAISIFRAGNYPVQQDSKFLPIASACRPDYRKL